MTTAGAIAVDDPREPDIRALLERHLAFSRSETPPEHSFALDVDGLLDPVITFFSYRSPSGLLGVGALKELDREHAEVKSMHTAAEARGHGVGRAMLNHLLAVARSRGYRRVFLETGTTPGFAAARALYESTGFTDAEPFADYARTIDNTFYTLALPPSLGPGGLVRGHREELGGVGLAELGVLKAGQHAGQLADPPLVIEADHAAARDRAID